MDNTRFPTEIINFIYLTPAVEQPALRAYGIREPWSLIRSYL